MVPEFQGYCLRGAGWWSDEIFLGNFPRWILEMPDPATAFLTDNLFDVVFTAKTKHKSLLVERPVP